MSNGKKFHRIIFIKNKNHNFILRLIKKLKYLLKFYL